MDDVMNMMEENEEGEDPVIGLEGRPSRRYVRVNGREHNIGPTLKRAQDKERHKGVEDVIEVPTEGLPSAPQFPAGCDVNAVVVGTVTEITVRHLVFEQRDP